VPLQLTWHYVSISKLLYADDMQAKGN